MNEECKHYQEYLIDIYYKEKTFSSDLTNHLEDCQCCKEFWLWMENMGKTVENADFEASIEYERINEIMEKANTKELNRQNFKSLVCFIFIASVIMSVILVLVVKGYEMSIAYFQLGMYFILPLLVPIIIKVRGVREGYYDSI